MNPNRCITICSVIAMLSLTACSSPIGVVPPSGADARAYEKNIVYPTAMSIRASIAGVRSAEEGLVIDLLVTGESDRAPECATILARAITGQFANEYLQIQDGHGHELALRPQVHEIGVPWVVGKQWPAPPQWPLNSGAAGRALIQALPFGSPTLPGGGEYRARFRPDARDKLLAEESRASECAGITEFDTDWHYFDVRRME